MSSVYIRRIRSLNDEYLAARGALAYVARSWQAHTIVKEREFELVGPQDIKNAVEHLEETFIIRLFAEFEGMLKEYLSQHHPGIAVPEDARAVWLIDRVATLQSPHIVQPLRMRVHMVRRYRNALVHSGITMPLPLQFGEARSSLNTYLDKLPEPLR